MNLSNLRLIAGALVISGVTATVTVTVTRSLEPKCAVSQSQALDVWKGVAKGGADLTAPLSSRAANAP
jgi:hypothetical protein